MGKSQVMLRMSIGMIYIWFGALKFVEELSPAETLASDTIQKLTFHLIPEQLCCLLLGIGETAIGLFLVINILRRWTVILALIHMAFTFTPIFLMPEVFFVEAPFTVTLAGQYIIKNLIIISALIKLYPDHRPRLAFTERKTSQGPHYHRK